MEQLRKALGLKEEKIICAVGGGGKTSLLFRLGEEYRREGKRVLLTTTTKMALPEKYGALDRTGKEIIQQLDRDGFVVAGTTWEGIKMSELPLEIYRQVSAEADVVLIEADGSKRLPLKMPREGEPVLPERYDFLVTVLGLTGLNKPLEEVCHRWELAREALGWQEGRRVTPEDAALLLRTGYGSWWRRSRGCVFLNQADAAGETAARQTAAALGEVPCLWGSLQEGWYRSAL